MPTSELRFLYTVVFIVLHLDILLWLFSSLCKKKELEFQIILIAKVSYILVHKLITATY
jgi:hypothetical protein